MQPWVGPIGIFNSVTGYAINSAALFDGSSGYLSWTPGVADSRDLVTFNFWVQRTKLGVEYILGNYTDGNNQFGVRFNSNDNLVLESRTGGVACQLNTSAVFRDLTAPLNITITWDSNNATASHRARIYVNGVRITAFGTETYPTLGTDIFWNINGDSQVIGQDNLSANYTSVYLSEFHCIDDQALDPTSFGEFNSKTNRWEPLAYSGTYGTNGFYLKFEDGALGTDSSGNGNNWTVNGTVTAVTNTPTDVVATLNPIDTPLGSRTFSDGNLTVSHHYAATSYPRTQATLACPTSGKWYWEARVDTASPSVHIFGIREANAPYTTGVGALGTAPTASFGKEYSYLSNGNKGNLGTSSAYGSAWNTVGKVIGVAYNADDGELTYYIDGVSQGVAATGIDTTVEYYPCFDQDTTTSVTITGRFAEADWSYSAPAGYKALTSSNLPKVTGVLSDHFVQGTYTGNGTSQTINFTDAQGNAVDWGSDDYLLMIKRTNASASWFWSDTLRGAGIRLRSDTTDVEDDLSSQLTAQTGTGFSVAGTGGAINASGSTYSFQAFRAGTEVTNTDGTISAQVSANQDLGFSIITYTGNVTSGATLGHGLNQEVGAVIIKSRNFATVWTVQHDSLANDGILYLNQTNAEATSPASFNSTKASSTLITLGNAAATNGSGYDFVMYVFAKDSPFLKCFDFDANGSADGSFEYLSGTPVFDFRKRTDASDQWVTANTSMSPDNPVDRYLRLNTSGAETSGVVIQDNVAVGIKRRVSFSGNHIGVAVVDPIGSNRPPRGE